MVEKMAKNGRAAGAQTSPPPSGSRSRRTLAAETVILTPEDVQSFEGDTIVGEVHEQGPVFAEYPSGGPAPSARKRAPAGSRRSQRDPLFWTGSDKNERISARRIDSLGSPAVAGWRTASQTHMLERLAEVEAGQDIAFQWHEHLSRTQGVDPTLVAAAREAMMEQNLANLDPGLLREAHQLRFGDVDDDVLGLLVQERVQETVAGWDADTQTPYPIGHERSYGHMDAGPTDRTRARDDYRTGGKSRRAAEDKLREESNVRNDLLDSDNLNERDQLRLLRLNSRVAAEQYMTSLRESNILAPGFNDADREKKLSAIQKRYVQVMIVGAMAPLKNGVDKNSVVQALGSMTTMMLLSKDFREEVGNYLEPVKKQLEDRTRNKALRMGMNAEDLSNIHNTVVDARTDQLLADNPKLAQDEKFMASREKQRSSRNDNLPRRWARRLDAYDRQARGNRELYTAESAAMTEIGLTENAFWKTREKGADVEKITQSYRAMMNMVREQAAADGLSRTDVATCSRNILGRRMEAEPELGIMFNGMAHGKYEKCAPHEVKFEGSDRVRTVWTGAYQDQMGKRVPEDAMFTLRDKMDAVHHQASMAQVMGDRMMHDLEHGGMSAFNDSFAGYAVGYTVALQNHAATPEKIIDESMLRPDIAARTQQSEAMLSAMAVDGLDMRERQSVYSNAYVDAIENVRSVYPEFARDWDRQFGATWQEQMKDAVADPTRFQGMQRIPDGQTYERTTREGRTFTVPASAPEDDFQP